MGWVGWGFTLQLLNMTLEYMCTLDTDHISQPISLTFDTVHKFVIKGVLSKNGKL